MRGSERQRQRILLSGYAVVFPHDLTSRPGLATDIRKKNMKINEQVGVALTAGGNPIEQQPKRYIQTTEIL
jgi:hypothetical protein